MEIPGELFKSITSSVEEFKTHLQYELEVKYNGKLTRDAFANLLSYVKAQQGVREEESVEVLDINFNYNSIPYRLSIKGRDRVQEYCTTGKAIVDEIMSKKLIEGYKPIFINDYGLKLNMKEESEVAADKVPELQGVLNDIPKTFRYKKRYSYYLESLRIDLTVVKQIASTSHKAFSNAPETYEAEVEVIKRDVETGKLVKELLKAGVQIYAIVNNIRHLITKREANSILEQYYNLWKPATAKHGILTAPEKQRRQYFLGPQAITLELKNVVSDGLPVNTIRDDYTVTEKADGERYLLYVDATGKGYFLNNKLEVMPTKVSGLPRLTLIDGEFITQDAQRHRIELFAIFDVYYYEGKEVTGEKLIDGRLSYAERFHSRFQKAFETAGILLHVKRFYHGPDIFKEAAKLHAKVMAKQYLYRVDGLIFTPKNLPVGALYEGGVPDPNSTWNLLFKWKPPEENTIDMLAREMTKGKITMIEGKLHKVYNLYVGYKASKWEALSPKAYLERNLRQDHQYTLTLFNPPGNMDRDLSSFYGEVVDDIVMCKNGDVIANNSIVEFSYRPGEMVRWIPLRVRKDKDMPNDWGTAMNVWRSLSSPVTEEIITGKVSVLSKNLPPEDVYYSRNISRDKFASRRMMNFHSFWVKGNYVFKGLSEIKTLFDIACGKGGDLRKWKDLGIKTVYGIDKVRDNIENPNDGIYARMLKRPEEYARLNYVFGTFDASQRISSASLNGLKGDDLYIMQKLLRHGSFDVVSCQMAIHYFFESEAILDNMLYNVDKFLKPGGYFVGTCLDGNLVKALFRAEGSAIVNGKQDTRLLWNIAREYSDDYKVEFGDVIKIYMESIGIEMPEYLVNMNTLIHKLKELGIEFVKTLPFKDIYAEVEAMKEDSRQGMFEPMSEVEKIYSFLNIVFVFKKGAEPVAPPKIAPSSHKKSPPKKTPSPPVAAAPTKNYKIGIAKDEGDCFYLALYGAAKHNNMLDRLTQCLFNRPASEFEDEMMFVRQLRDLLVKLIIDKRDYDSVHNLYDNLTSSNAKTHRHLVEMMPKWFTRKYGKKRPESEDVLRTFMAENVGKMGSWVSEFEVRMIDAVFKDCATIGLISFNERIPPNTIFESNVLYLLNENDNHFNYLIFDDKPKKQLTLKVQEKPIEKKKIVLKKLSKDDA